ncbi:MAG: YlbF family regulator [Anaerolineae bacterium]
MLDPNLEQTVREFAAWLAQAPPLAALRKAQEQLEADEEAQRLLGEWDNKQQELLQRQRDGQAISMAEITPLRQLQNQIRAHPAVITYNEMRKQAQSYLTNLCAEISQTLQVDWETLSQGAGEEE